MSEPARAPASSDADLSGGPFRFLDPYTGAREDRRIFAGRDKEIQDLVAGILRARTLVLYGRSGIGKTSLLLAGVVPELESRGFRVAMARVLDRPLADVREAVAASAGRSPGKAGSLGDELRAASEGRGIILVLDQFEEFFIRFRDRPDARWELVRALADALADTSLDGRVLFSLREDYLAELDELRERLPDLFTNEYRLRPLTAFGARQAISRALQHHGVRYEQRLLTGLVDALQEYGYDPTILQILGSELYREVAVREAGPVSLEAKDLETLGGLQGVFRRYAESLERDLSSDRLLLAQAILDRMMTGERTRDAVTVEDLSGSYFAAEPGEVEEILDLLIRHRLVCSLGHDRFELVHDRLVEPLGAWLERSPRFSELRFASDMVARAVRGGAFRNNPDLLLTAGQVQQVWKLRERLRFSSEGLELLLRSAIHGSSPYVTYWADRYGREASPELVIQLLESKQVEVRRAAAKSAGWLRDKEGQLADLCLARALDDPDDKVRRTCGASFALLRGPVQDESLLERLRSRKTRGPALEVVADLLQANRPLEDLNWFWRKRAERIVRERALRKSREEIHQRGASGARYGAFAGLLYVLCVLALSSFWSRLWGWIDDNLLKFGLILGWGLLLVPVLGGFSGWRLGASAAKLAGVDREARWSRAVWRSGSHFLILCLVCLPLALGLAGRYFFLAESPLAGIAVAALAHGLIGAQMILVQPCFARKLSTVKSWLWIVVLGFGIPVMATALANNWLESRGLPGGWIAVGILWSFGSFVAAAALAQSQRKLGAEPV